MLWITHNSHIKNFWADVYVKAELRPVESRRRWCALRRSGCRFWRERRSTRPNTARQVNTLACHSILRIPPPAIVFRERSTEFGWRADVGNGLVYRGSQRPYHSRSGEGRPQLRKKRSSHKCCTKPHSLGIAIECTRERGVCCLHEAADSRKKYQYVAKQILLPLLKHATLLLNSISL